MSDSLVRLPKALYRAAQVRQLDHIAIDEFSCSGFELMQTAASAVLRVTLERWPNVRSVHVFAGNGNNAGDGFICAALASQQGLSSQVVLLGDPAKLGSDAALAFKKAKSAEVKMIGLDEYNGVDGPEQTVIIDALLGTGLDRPVDGSYAEAIDTINSAGAPVVAVDIPSGLSADTGMPLGVAIKADLTVTFIGMKQGMLTGQGRDFCGGIVFDDLDIPDKVYSSEISPKPSALRIDINFATRCLPPRNASNHKGSNGHVVVVGGDTGFGGAAILSAQAALRAGAGLVSVISRSAHRTAALARCPEIMWHGTEDQNGSDSEVQIQALLSRANVIVVGPGLGRGPWSVSLFNHVLSSSRANGTPLVIDADALHLLSDRAEPCKAFQSTWVLTPHPGEAAALLNCSVAEVQQNRFESVERLARTFGGSCLLKGSGSLISHETDPEAIQLCTEGNPGMGSGGMGDLLSGLIAGFAAQGISLDQSLSCAVCIHGEAGDLEAESEGERGLIASDLLPWLRQLVNPPPPPR